MAARKNRDQMIIATKVGSQMGNDPTRRGLTRKHIMESVDDSLQRLQTDYIDLYQAHSDDPNTPLEETLSVFNDLIKQGKVRYIGASNYTAQRLTEALGISLQHGYGRYESLQPPYNLIDRQIFESELDELCREQEIGIITYSSLASGFLTGKYHHDQELPSSPRAQGVQSNYMNARGFAILDQVEKIAQAHHVTPTQVALAWIIAHPGITAPIASATSVAQVHELLNAVNLRLTQDEGLALNRVSEWRPDSVNQPQTVDQG
jgi:aryl-alcohol dehydrogenase-like predicted oxidoreductase